jgi:hypothetical protein
VLAVKNNGLADKGQTKIFFIRRLKISIICYETPTGTRNVIFIFEQMVLVGDETWTELLGSG